VYTSSVIDVNDDTVAFIAVISPHTNQITSSVNSHVTVKLSTLIHARFVHSISTSGAFVSYLYSTVHSTVLHSSSVNTTVHSTSHSESSGGVTLIPFHSHSALHVLHSISHVILIVPLPHNPSYAHILSIKSLYNTSVHVTVVLYSNEFVVNEGCVFVHV
jgi:hypothetical protein